MTAAADADRPLVLWSYQSVSSDHPDRILVYNWQLRRWTHLHQDADLIWRAQQRDSAPIGHPRTACFDATHRGALFTGSPKDASITTNEYQFNPRGRCLIREVYPVLEGDATPTTSVLHRKDLSDAPVATPATTVNTLGFSPLRVENRFMRFAHTMPAASTWSKWRGLKVDPTPTGVR